MNRNSRRAPAVKTAALLACLLAAAVSADPVPAQTDLQRETVAVTYPLEQSITVKFRGTTRLPRLKGEAKVRRTGRRGTRVELSIEDLPRAYELGTVYTVEELTRLAAFAHERGMLLHVDGARLANAASAVQAVQDQP